MQRINAMDPQTASGTAKTLLDGVQRKLGFVPNLMRTLAVSPATLDAYLSFNDRLSHGILSPKLREQLALTVAYSNSCEYCLAAHTAIGGMLGLSPSQLEAAYSADSSDPQIAAVLPLRAASRSEPGARQRRGHGRGSTGRIRRRRNRRDRRTRGAERVHELLQHRRPDRRGLPQDWQVGAVSLVSEVLPYWLLGGAGPANRFVGPALPRPSKRPCFLKYGNGRNLDDDSHSTTIHAGDRLGQGACRRRRLELSRSRSRLIGLLHRLDLAQPRSVLERPRPRSRSSWPGNGNGNWTIGW